MFTKQRKQKTADRGFMRRYSLLTLILMFFILGISGWIWEVVLHLLRYGELVNRGVLHGPWLPIYGSGGILILLLLNKLRKYPMAEFSGIIVLCGIVEYLTSWALEMLHHGKRWWDYTGYFLNLNGRICAESLLIFGMGGMIFVYVVEPLLDNHLANIRPTWIPPLCAILSLLFIIDITYSVKYPNTGDGISTYSEETRQQESEINEICSTACT